MPISEDGIRPILTTVVKLRSYGKAIDPHFSKKKQRPHFFILTSDFVRIFTTSDAGTFDDHSSIKGSSGITKTTNAALAPFSKLLIHSKHSPASDPLDEEELDDAQVFRMGASLNQILDVVIVKGNRVVIYYQPNKPSKRSIHSLVEEQTHTMLRSIKEAVEYMTGKDDDDALEKAIPHRNITNSIAHHFTIETSDAHEARLIKNSIKIARKKLIMAILWLSDGLPLTTDCQAIMITAGPRQSNSNIHTVPFPSWNSEIDLPDSVSIALAGGARAESDILVKAYISTPLGTAIAEMPLAEIQNSAFTGGAELTALATIHEHHAASSCTAAGGLSQIHEEEEEEDRNIMSNFLLKKESKKMEVCLHWKAVQGEIINDSNVSGIQDIIPIKNIKSSSFMRRSISGRHSHALWPSMPMPTLLQWFISHARSPLLPALFFAALAIAIHYAYSSSNTISTPLLLAALVVSLAGNVSAVVSSRRHQQQGSDIASKPNSSHIPISAQSSEFHRTAYRWKLVLLDVEIVEETRETDPAIPLHTRTLSLSSVSMKRDPTVPAHHAIPSSIRILIDRYPTVITPDIAQRFINGLGSEAKAKAGLEVMARWMIENKLDDILTRPQPVFCSMKKHYPHGYPGWSKKKDALVEIECMGVWPDAYNGIAADGFSDQDMLDYLLFNYEYTFQKLDPRPLPNGKTIKIVDLNGLKMTDLRTPGFKLITRVGAMLSVNFPQRLQHCFLINAPGWWAVAWRLISPIVPSKVRANMSLYSKNEKESALKALLEWVDEEVLPVQYGGKNVQNFSQWQYEIQMAAYVASLNG